MNLCGNIILSQPFQNFNTFPENPPLEDAERRLGEGCTVTYAAVDGKLAGYLALSDTLRKESAATIKLNMTFSVALNFAAIVLAIIGTLDLVAGALVHNAGSVLVITNSAFLLKWRKNSGDPMKTESRPSAALSAPTARSAPFFCP